MSVIRLVVPASLDGVRVDKAVALVADLSRATVDRLVGEGRVAVDGEAVPGRATVVRAGQLLEVDPGRAGQRAEAPGADPGVPVTVVHEDPAVVVVDKPPGLVVHPGAGHPAGTLVNGLLARYPELAALPAATGTDPTRPGIVHRLDRGTSGLLVVARTEGAYRSLVAQLQDRRVTRRYRTLVGGRVDADSGVVDAPIGRSATAPTRMAVSRRGRDARTRYTVLARFRHPTEAALLEVSLETGRTHQIRVHLSSIGHPVVGDAAYRRGGPTVGTQLERPFLHAATLSFEHPGDGRTVTFVSELPTDLRAELARFET